MGWNIPTRPNVTDQYDTSTVIIANGKFQIVTHSAQAVTRWFWPSMAPVSDFVLDTDIQQAAIMGSGVALSEVAFRLDKNNNFAQMQKV